MLFPAYISTHGQRCIIQNAGLRLCQSTLIEFFDEICLSLNTLILGAKHGLLAHLIIICHDDL